MTTFWCNKKVFITGHTGFKGSWLSLWLQLLGADVVGFALPPSTSINLFTLANVAANMTSIIGDIRDVDLLKKTLRLHQPDIIIHLAAQALVSYSYREPVATYATNVMGSVNLLAAVKETPTVKVLINVTTDKCYENKGSEISYREDDRLGGRDPYSSSKACAELVTQAFYQSYFEGVRQLGVATARAGNVIGGGDWAAGRLVPDIINACIRDDTVLIRYPNARRPWQHVLEPLHGYLLLAEHLWSQPEEFSSSWNFGPADADGLPVRWIADYIMQQWGNNANWRVDSHEYPHEEKYLQLDCSKAQSCLQWQPRWDITRALNETVAWYKAYIAQENMRDKTLIQINHFLQSQPINSLETFYD